MLRTSLLLLHPHTARQAGKHSKLASAARAAAAGLCFCCFMLPQPQPRSAQPCSPSSSSLSSSEAYSARLGMLARAAAALSRSLVAAEQASRLSADREPSARGGQGGGAGQVLAGGCGCCCGGTAHAAAAHSESSIGSPRMRHLQHCSRQQRQDSCVQCPMAAPAALPRQVPHLGC